MAVDSQTADADTDTDMLPGLGHGAAVAAAALRPPGQPQLLLRLAAMKVVCEFPETRHLRPPLASLTSHRLPSLPDPRRERKQKERKKARACLQALPKQPDFVSLVCSLGFSLCVCLSLCFCFFFVYS